MGLFTKMRPPFTCLRKLKCPKAFDDTSENYWKEKYLAEHREKEDYAKKVGQLAMQVDWLKKKSEEVLGPGYEDKFTPKPFEE